MKTFLLAAATLIAGLQANAKTNTVKTSVNIAAIKTLEQNFGGVDKVNWEPASNNMLRASFEKDGETVHAFFDYNGELVASTTDVPAADLPGAVKRGLAEQVKEGQIAESIRYTDNDEEAYFVKIVSGNVQRLFKCSVSGLVKEVKF